MTGKVTIVGAGVAGLTAAQELAERGIPVMLLDAAAEPGGKSRSMGVTGSSSAGRPELPCEHGFRFLPGFYRHLPDTMSRIPFESGSVVDNLVPTTYVQIARAGGRSELLAPARFPGSVQELTQAFHFLRTFGDEFGIPAVEVRYFVRQLLRLMVSCHARRFGEYEYRSWQDFIGADRMSSAYRRYLGHAMSRSLVALDPRRLSTRTGGYTLLQFLFDFSMRPGRSLDRVLNGPTQDVWLRPWRDYLLSLGVEWRPGTRLVRMMLDQGRVARLWLTHGNARYSLEVEDVILALPVERLRQVLTDEVYGIDPGLRRLSRLTTSWMSGVCFYLRRDVPIVHGHTNYVDSPWALTSVSQPQFWQPRFAPCYYGNGDVRGILSVIVSNWDEPGTFCRKPARRCTPHELIREVWRQMKDHLNDQGECILRDEDLLHWYIAPSMQFDASRGWSNQEPLLINTIGSWRCRPEVTTKVANLFLAGDFVRTHTDLATMEAANESARRAVNALLEARALDKAACPIWAPAEPVLFHPIQKLDELRYHRGDPPDIPVMV